VCFNDFHSLLVYNRHGEITAATKKILRSQDFNSLPKRLVTIGKVEEI
jgi:hypothetical protein